MSDNESKTTSKERPSLRYTVEVHRREEEGGLKTIDWDGRDFAVECAEIWHAKGYTVQVRDNHEQKLIFDSQSHTKGEKP